MPHLGFYIEQGGARLQGGFKWLANASQTTKDYFRPLASLAASCARAFFASHPPHSLGSHLYSPVSAPLIITLILSPPSLKVM